MNYLQGWKKLLMNGNKIQGVYNIVKCFCIVECKSQPGSIAKKCATIVILSFIYTKKSSAF